MDVAGLVGLIHAEAAALQNFYHAQGLRKTTLPIIRALRRADYLGTAAEKNVRVGRRELPAQVALEVAGGQIVLQVTLADVAGQRRIDVFVSTRRADGLDGAPAGGNASKSQAGLASIAVFWPEQIGTSALEATTMLLSESTTSLAACGLARRASLPPTSRRQRRAAGRDG
jgi:hypothetical protein